MPKNIAIVGSKPDTWEGCKTLDRRSWEIWRYSRKNYEKEPKATKWFELHHERNYNRMENSKPGYLQFLDDCKAVRYDDFPFGELIEEFGPWFFEHGQAPWLMAYAITKAPKEIRLFGIDPASDKYGLQRLEVNHFMGVAKSRGIEVTAPEDPGLFEYGPLYAIEQDWGGQAKYLKGLRQRGIQIGTQQMRVTQQQTEFAADIARNEALAEVQRRKQARLEKYGPRG